jgi:hypothetical protein
MRTPDALESTVNARASFICDNPKPATVGIACHGNDGLVLA